MIGKTEIIQSKDFKTGLVTRSDIINPDPNQSPNCMDIKWYFDNVIGKRLGSTTTNSVIITSGQSAGWIIGNGLTSGLQAYWKLDEASGTRVDAYNGLNLSDVNATSSITGIRNQGALFVSTNSNALLAQNTGTIQTGNIPFTIAGWVYLNSTSNTAQGSIVSKRDPNVDAATSTLLHCDGTNGSTTFTDSSPSPKTYTANGDAQVSTAQFKFGTGSLLCDGTGDFLSTPTDASFNFGTGDFTIDFWVRFISRSADVEFTEKGAGGGQEWSMQLLSSNTFRVQINGAVVKSETWNPSNDTWYHVALTRSGTSLDLWIDGTKLGSTTSNNSNITGSDGVSIGASTTGARSLNGYIDEFRISKGIARWTANFTPPTAPYSVAAYEYWVYVDTNGSLRFSVSSSNLAADGTVSASTMALGTWYNFIAWHQTAGGSTAGHIGIALNNVVTTAGYTAGVKIGSAPLLLGALSSGNAGRAQNFLDARVDEVGFWKRMFSDTDRANIYAGGSGNTFNNGADASGWYSFDFGASGNRWLTVCMGTGILASSNCGTTFVTIATTRTATYQYLDRSRNVLIATSDAYDPTLYWAGSAGTFASVLAINSAPKAKFSINYQGFCVLLNSMDSNGVISNRRFSYADENLQLTSQWRDGFDLPSSADDEITGPFILNKFLYVSTKFRIFRLNYTGGNPDWQYIQVKNFGFVPRTIKVFTLKQGQVAVGLDWSRRLRAFDGYDDQIISDNVENDNDYCEFGMQRISLAGSGLTVSNAEFDPIQQEYRLNVAIGAMSTQTTHAIVLNARTLSMYPYSNQPYNTMCVAESAGRQFMMAFDRSGYCHILNSGNMDVARPINEIYDSPLLFKNSPTQVSKNNQVNFYFGHDSCGTIYFQERFDFSRIYSEMRPLRDYNGNAELLGTESSLQLVRTTDIKSVQNVYQYRITSSAGTANPWKLTHTDLLNTGLGYGRGA